MTYDHNGNQTSQSELVALSYDPASGGDSGGSGGDSGGSGGTIDWTTAASNFSYDAMGDLTEAVDADGRTIDYSYDHLYRQTAQTWYDSSDTEVGSMTFSYNTAGNLSYASNSASGSTVASYSYYYNPSGQVATENVQLGGMSSNVALQSTYDYNGNRLSFAATIGATVNTTTGAVSGGTLDFTDSYSYDALGTMTSVQRVLGASTVDATVKFTYDPANRLSTTEGYFGPASTDYLAVTAAYNYNDASQLSDLVYSEAVTSDSANSLPAYHWDYNSAGLISDFYSRADSNAETPDSSYVVGTSNWGHAAYSYDNVGELTATRYENFANAPTTDTSGGHDSNGNRIYEEGTSSEYVTPSNRMLFDGTYYYTYDAAGNRTSRYELDDDGDQIDVTTYNWNNANQLTSVVSGDTTVSYSYDAFGEMVSRTVTTDGSGSSDYYVYDGQNLVIVMDSAGAAQERFLYGPSGQVLGYDIASGGTGGGDYFYWNLSDGQGSVRSVSMSLPAGGGAVETGVLDSLVYDSFGQVTSQSNPDYQPGFTYDGKWQDPLTGLSLMDGTWYDSVNSVYVSDPPETNPYEFDGDDPTGANTTPTQFGPDVNPSPVGVMDAGSGGSDIPVYEDDGSASSGDVNWPGAFLDFGSATQNGSYQPQNAGGMDGDGGLGYSNGGPEYGGGWPGLADGELGFGGGLSFGGSGTGLDGGGPGLGAGVPGYDSGGLGFRAGGSGFGAGLSWAAPGFKFGGCDFLWHKAIGR